VKAIQPSRSADVTSTRATAELDEITLERARRGNRDAFRQLVERYERPVFSVLGRMLYACGKESLVDDLAQETFVRVFRALGSFGADGRHRLSSWILTIATRLAIDELRKPQHTEPFSARHDLASDVRADRDSERRGVASAIERAVAALSPEHRATFLLREVHDFEYDEIAEALKVDLGTVKSRLSRARTALRAALKGIHDEVE